MARSTYIYVVTNLEDKVPLACFTIEHEMEEWCDMWFADHPLARQLYVFRFWDGVAKADYRVQEYSVFRGGGIAACRWYGQADQADQNPIH